MALLSSNAPRLCLHILHGKVTALVELKGQIVASKTHAKSCSNPQELAPLVMELVSALNFKGNNVSVVFADNSVAYAVVNTPPMRPKELRQFLERRAKQEWKSKEAFRIAWSPLKVREGKAALLQVVSEAWIQAVVKICRKNGWQPNHFMTVSAAAVHHLETDFLGVQLLALDTGTTALLVVRRGNEDPVLVRELSTTWNTGLDGPMRVAQELQRTQLFAKQQLGAAVDRMILHGNGSSLLAQVAQSVTGIEPSCEDQEVLWALPLGSGQEQGSDNLFSNKELSHNRERRRMVVLALIQMIALFGFFGAYLHVRHNLDEVDLQLEKMDIASETTRLSEEKMALLAVRAEIDRNLALADTVKRQSKQPLAGWMAGVIADLIPNGMTLKRMEIQKDSMGYFMSLEGFVPRNPLISAKLLSDFESNIRELPVRYDTHMTWETTWIENLKFGATWEADEVRKHFVIRGRIQ